MDISTLISHPEEGNIKEKTLKEHLCNVAEKSRKIILKMRLNLSLLKQEDLAEISFIIGMLHDFGKATSYFQEYVRNLRNSNDYTNHGFVSALVTYYAIEKCLDLEDSDLKRKFQAIAYLVVKRHHGNLETIKSTDDDESLKTSIDVAKKQLKNIEQNHKSAVSKIYQECVIPIFDIINAIDFEEFSDFLDDDAEYIFDPDDDKIEQDKNIELFFIANLLFSVLIDCDKKDAARLDDSYFEGNLEEPENDIFSYIEDLRKQNPEKFSQEIPINRIRTEFLEEISANDKITPENHFYTITAPTGIGKTFGCLAFANKLKNLLPKGEGRIIYALPYTSIIDQNYDEFKRIIEFNKKELFEKRPERYLLKHHHLTFGKIENRTDEDDYSYKSYLDDKLFVESWESSMIVTTFVQFFHTMIGFRNKFLKKFHNIVNSIVILDEVQNVDPNYYRLLKRTLKILGEKFNIYFLLITATQPEILEDPIDLIDASKYMKNELFNRVRMSYDHDTKNVEEFYLNFAESFEGKNCLIVLNTRKAAIETYKYLSENMRGYEFFCLTTYLIPKDRKKKIEEIKNNVKNHEKIIVISTQMIEAGVDVSFEYVFRDLGPFDSIVQVAGRCNRSGEYGILGGSMTLLSLGTSNNVYDKFLIQTADNVLQDTEYSSSDFYQLSKEYFSKFDYEEKSRKLLKAIWQLNYDSHIKDQIPVSEFKLIEDDYSDFSIYLLTDKESDENMQKLLELIYEIKGNPTDKDNNKKLLEIEILKGFLKNYQLNLREKEITPYNHLIENKESFYQYVSFKNIAEIYNKKIGFLKKTKEESGVIQL